jgi:hypothetical protein
MIPVPVPLSTVSTGKQAYFSCISLCQPCRRNQLAPNIIGVLCPGVNISPNILALSFFRIAHSPLAPLSQAWEKGGVRRVG